MMQIPLFTRSTAKISAVLRPSSRRYPAVVRSSLRGLSTATTRGTTAAKPTRMTTAAPTAPTGTTQCPVQKRPLPSEEERLERWSPRAPVVTIMGHVDHGKTTLLDALRKTSVAASEAGGITQHIGAFSVTLPSTAQITFLDTPGHAAFTSMRARGAQVTDIVVLVVAADDGIMPQTVEAIHHARAAGVPIVVAINKCDKPTAKPMRIQQQLMDHHVITEPMGGDTPCVLVSAQRGDGLADLEETILTVAEIMELRGDPAGPCETTVLESRLVHGRGTVATVLVQRGTLKPGAVLVFGQGKAYCRVRRIQDERAAVLREAGPSMPCEIMGAWSGLPGAGEEGVEVSTEDAAKQCLDWNRQRLQLHHQQHASVQIEQKRKDEMASHERKTYDLQRYTKQMNHLKGKGDRALYAQVRSKISQLRRELDEMELLLQQQQHPSAATTTENAGSSSATNAAASHVLHLVIKGDVHGSVEAVAHSLQGLTKLNRKKSSGADDSSSSSSTTAGFLAAASLPERMEIRVLHSGVGPITTSDVELLAAAQKANREPGVLSKHFLIGFNVPQPSKPIGELIQRYRIPTVTHNIIYNLLDDVKGHMAGMLKPDYSYEVVGEAEVLALFAVNQGKEMVAGCRVQQGTVFRNSSSTSTSSSPSPSSPNATTIKTRLFRNGVKLYEGPMRSLKHHKNDVQSISKGMECGISFGDLWADVQVGDVIQTVKEVELAPQLE